LLEIRCFHRIRAALIGIERGLRMLFGEKFQNEQVVSIYIKYHCRRSGYRTGSIPEKGGFV
jgi:hypothetical protein